MTLFFIIILEMKLCVWGIFQDLHPQQEPMSLRLSATEQEVRGYSETNEHTVEFGPFMEFVDNKKCTEQ